MNARGFWRIVATALLTMGVGAGFAYAKLPQAPMDDAAKAKTEEAKAKAAAAAKGAREAEEKAMDRVVERYKKEKGLAVATTGKPASAAKPAVVPVKASEQPAATPAPGKK